VLKNDVQLNPRGLRLPSGETLSGDDMKRFKARQLEIDALRAGQEPGSLVAGAKLGLPTVPIEPPAIKR